MPLNTKVYIMEIEFLLHPSTLIIVFSYWFPQRLIFITLKLSYRNRVHCAEYLFGYVSLKYVLI